MDVTGVGEAAQAVEASARVAEVAVNSGAKMVELSVSGLKGTIRIITKLAHFTNAMIEKIAHAHLAKINSHDLVPGEMDLSDLLAAAADKKESTHIMQIDEQLLPLFEKFVADNKLSYSYLFNLNEKDHCKEVMFTDGESQIFSAFVHENPEFARMISHEDYINNATSAGWQRVTDTLERAVKEQLNKEEKPVGSMDMDSFLKNYGTDYAACYQVSDYIAFAGFADSRIPYTAYSLGDNSAAILVPRESYGDMNQYISDTGGTYCQISDFLNTYPEMDVSKELKDLAAKGSGVPLTEKQEFYTIDSEQIIDVNDVSVKFAVKTEDGRDMAAILPREELLKTDEPDRYYLKVSGDDTFLLYDDMDRFTRMDSENNPVSVPQTASAWVTGTGLCECAKLKSDEIIQERFFGTRRNQHRHV